LHIAAAGGGAVGSRRCPNKYDKYDFWKTAYLPVFFTQQLATLQIFGFFKLFLGACYISILQIDLHLEFQTLYAAHTNSLYKAARADGQNT